MHTKTILAGAILILSCKKEHQTANATDTLQSQYGQCLPSSQHGSFYNGIPASIDSDYVEIQVDVTSPGACNIKTDKQNGVTFSATGTSTGKSREACEILHEIQKTMTMTNTAAGNRCPAPLTA